MGGRGASSGISDKGKAYGTQYHTRLEADNIKFVSKNIRQAETLMETMTSGRIYVETGSDNLLRILTFDSENKRNRVIERDKRTGKWHVHTGYFHTEKGLSAHESLTNADKILIAKIERMWYSKHGKS